ncbi:hypothetical protein [Candidatus Formimonas warabiya]|uniref:Uncharacterized protein n=1 Tax=Formimonas warabiya TaxID=1761012 RepID=A0A3G1KMI1_FORW1|nr:hypothetical protein [Candidatus Formimonas warabiya]ATW23660.1 hypothetical protein DCMF_01585 [Candidatus Formimonas warabiya]
MEDFFEKIKEYLKMDSEISYEEFAAFYSGVMEHLNKNYADLDRDALIKGRFICSILQANSLERSKRKTPEAKKFKKMMEKSQFWAGAIKHRLLKEGMTVSEIEEADKALHEAV